MLTTRVAEMWVASSFPYYQELLPHAVPCLCCILQKYWILYLLFIKGPWSYSLPYWFIFNVWTFLKIATQIIFTFGSCLWSQPWSLCSPILIKNRARIHPFIHMCGISNFILRSSLTIKITCVCTLLVASCKRVVNNASVLCHWHILRDVRYWEWAVDHHLFIVVMMVKTSASPLPGIILRELMGNISSGSKMKKKQRCSWTNMLYLSSEHYVSCKLCLSLLWLSLNLEKRSWLAYRNCVSTT